METLLYVRHGTSEFNLERRFGGLTDTPLAPRGVEEARLAATTATGLAIDSIVSSPLARCRRTAEIIAEQVGIPSEQIIVNELLVERSFGPLEGTPLRPEAEVDNLPGVESRDELIARAWKANAWLSALDAKHILVCGHGVFGRALRSTFRSDMPFVMPADERQRTSGIPNAVVTCWHQTCACCDYQVLEAT